MPMILIALEYDLVARDLSALSNGNAAPARHAHLHEEHAMPIPPPYCCLMPLFALAEAHATAVISDPVTW